MRGFSPDCQKHHRLYLDSISSGILIAQMVYDDQSQPADALILEVNSAFAAVVDRPKRVFGQEAQKSLSRTWAKVVTQMCRDYGKGGLGETGALQRSLGRMV